MTVSERSMSAARAGGGVRGSHAHFPVKHVDRIGFQVRGNCEFQFVPVVRPIWVRRVNASFVKESIIKNRGIAQQSVNPVHAGD